MTGIQWAGVSDYFLLAVTEYEDKAFVKTGGLAHGSRGCKSKDMLLATGEGLAVILQRSGGHHLVKKSVYSLGFSSSYKPISRVVRVPP